MGRFLLETNERVFRKIELYRMIIKDDETIEYKKRFVKLRGTKKVRVEKDCLTHAFSASLKIGARAKFLFLSALSELENNNVYAGFVLTRAFFETAAAMGFLTIRVRKRLNDKDLTKICEIANGFLIGGKMFPTDDHLVKVKRKRVESHHIYTLIDEVDEDISKKVKKSKLDSLSQPLREMYDTALSEFGHPNFLALNICSKIVENEDVINLSKSNSAQDTKFCLIHLRMGAHVFFDYWSEMKELLKDKFSLTDLS